MASSPAGDLPLPVLRTRPDWPDTTPHLATSWVGLFTAYAAALILVIAKFSRLTKGGRRAEGAALRLRLVGAAPIAATVYEPECLRRNLYGEIFEVEASEGRSKE